MVYSCAQGHGILAVEEMWAFYTGLGLIILGVGMLKPNISTMVGGLYQKGDIRRDKGFTIFYIGINIGAFLSSLIVGYVGEVHGWHYGFGLAGIGMALGQIIYMAGQKHLATVGNLMKNKKDEGVQVAIKNEETLDDVTTSEQTEEINLFAVMFKSGRHNDTCFVICSSGYNTWILCELGFRLLCRSIVVLDWILWRHV